MSSKSSKMTFSEFNIILLSIIILAAHIIQEKIKVWLKWTRKSSSSSSSSSPSPSPSPSSSSSSYLNMFLIYKPSWCNSYFIFGLTNLTKRCTSGQVTQTSKPATMKIRDPGCTQKLGGGFTYVFIITPTWGNDPI